MSIKIIKNIAVIAVIVLMLIGIKSFIDEQVLKFKYAAYPIRYTESVEKYAQEFGVDKYLLLALIKTESGFNKDAKSNADAIGLTQITEETFAWLKLKMCPNEPIIFEDLYTPEISIRFGAYYLSRCLQRYNGDVSTAAAAYHSGWGTVDRLLQENETEILTEFPYTQMEHYVYKINKAYKAYKELYSTSKGEI